MWDSETTEDRVGKGDGQKRKPSKFEEVLRAAVTSAAWPHVQLLLSFSRAGVCAKAICIALEGIERVNISDDVAKKLLRSTDRD